LQQLFSDTRFHKYFLGELHVMSNRCVPNGQRDYFEDTPEFRELEKGFRAFALSLEKLCRKASDISSSFKKIESHELARKQFEAKDGGGAFIGPDERREAQAEVTKKAADAEAAQEKIDSILDPSQGGNVEVLKALAKKQEDTIRERLEAARPKPEVSSPGEDTEQRSGSRRYLTSQLSDLNRRERKLVSRVYAIIKQVLPYDVAENLVAKIQEDLKISAKEGT
jgi:molecular chaperone HtpG